MSISRSSFLGLISGVLTLSLSAQTALADGLFTLDRSHKYLGFSTVMLAGATAATNGDIDTHKPLAYATAACALSTVITGYLTHGDRFDTSDGFFTQDNMHIAAGTIGALMLTTAVVLAAQSYDKDTDTVESSHAGLAAAGGVLMAVAIIDIKW